MDNNDTAFQFSLKDDNRDESREQMLDEMEKQFALSGYRDYIDSHFKEALEVYQNKGSMFDLDNIVHLEELLGHDVSYDLYCYIDSIAMYEDMSLQELSEKDIEDLRGLCREFADERGGLKMSNETGSLDVNETVSKYEMTDEMLYCDGHELHRIRALRDFGRVRAGDLGGYIEKTKNLSQNSLCWVYNEAKVYGDAQVFDAAEVSAEAIICGSALIYDDAQITASALVMDHAVVCDNAHVSENATVYGDAKISGKAMVTGYASVCNQSSVRDSASVSEHAIIRGSAIVADHAHVFGYASISENARLYGQSSIYDRAVVKGYAKTDGNTAVRDSAQISGYAVLRDRASISGAALVTGHAELSGNAIIKDYAQISGDAKLNGVCIVKDTAVVTGTASLNGWCRVDCGTKLDAGDWNQERLRNLDAVDKQVSMSEKQDEASKASQQEEETRPKRRRR